MVDDLRRVRCDCGKDVLLSGQRGPKNKSICSQCYAYIWFEGDKVFADVYDRQKKKRVRVELEDLGPALQGAMA